MKEIVKLSCLSMTLLFILILSANQVQAGSTSPSQPSGEPPRGLSVEGAAGGTKLSGTISLTFTRFFCSEPLSKLCEKGQRDLADAIIAVQLETTGNVYIDGYTSGNTNKLNRQQFSKFVPAVPYDDTPSVQGILQDEFRCPILAAFFGVQVDQYGECFSELAINLKDISEFWVYGITTTEWDDGAIKEPHTCPDDVPTCSEIVQPEPPALPLRCCDPPDPDAPTETGAISVMADLILAVK